MFSVQFVTTDIFSLFVGWRKQWFGRGTLVANLFCPQILDSPLCRTWFRLIDRRAVSYKLSRNVLFGCFLHVFSCLLRFRCRGGLRKYCILSGRSALSLLWTYLLMSSDDSCTFVTAVFLVRPSRFLVKVHVDLCDGWRWVDLGDGCSCL